MILFSILFIMMVLAAAAIGGMSGPMLAGFILGYVIVAYIRFNKNKKKGDTMKSLIIVSLFLSINTAGAQEGKLRKDGEHCLAHAECESNKCADPQGKNYEAWDGHNNYRKVCGVLTKKTGFCKEDSQCETNKCRPDQSNQNSNMCK